MNIKIDRNGLLHLQRGKEMRKQFCPFAPVIDGEQQRCGDWCPLYHIYKQQVELYCGHGICISAHSGETFTDERK